MATQRAKRNRTITLSDSAVNQYAGLCSRVCDTAQPENVIFHGDAFEILSSLPNRFVDLLIVDPPYNLSKVFGGKSFKKMSDEEYMLFTRRWLEAVSHTLKTNATVYVCGDWQTSLIVGRILGDFFTIQNRITWQREKGRGAMRNWKN